MPTPGSYASARAAVAVDLALDQRHGLDHGVEEWLELLNQAPVLLATRAGDRVEAAGAPVRMLPLPLDQPPRLEVAQQRIHRVGIRGDHAVGDPLDLLDQAVSVGGLPLDQVKHEEREHIPAANLATEHVHRSPSAPGLLARFGA